MQRFSFKRNSILADYQLHFSGFFKTEKADLLLSVAGPHASLGGYSSLDSKVVRNINIIVFSSVENMHLSI